MADDRKDQGFLGTLPFADRTFERARGCWNCTKWNNDGISKGKWTADRQMNLRIALEIASKDPLGEECERVKNIRGMVNALDHGVALGVWGICLAGKSETDYVHNAFLCDSWNGRQGASIATAGTKLDKLPEELRQDVPDAPELILGVSPKDKRR